MLPYIANTGVKIFILLAPFFILSVFVTMTEPLSLKKRRLIALRSSLAIWVVSLIVYFLGDWILRGLGITLNSFSIGAGLVLLLSALAMVKGSNDSPRSHEDTGDDIAVVPIAIPCAVGPGTTGALLVMGSESTALSRVTYDILAITLAIAVIGVILFYANVIERLVKKRGILILSKLTGLFLCALATQIIINGIKGALQ